MRLPLSRATSLPTSHLVVFSPSQFSTSLNTFVRRSTWMGSFHSGNAADYMLPSWVPMQLFMRLRLSRATFLLTYHVVYLSHSSALLLINPFLFTSAYIELLALELVPVLRCFCFCFFVVAVVVVTAAATSAYFELHALERVLRCCCFCCCCSSSSACYCCCYFCLL